MPLVHCPDCSQQVSDRAAACPQCGAPLCPPENRSISKAAIACGVALVILSIYFGFADYNPQDGLYSIGQALTVNLFGLSIAAAGALAMLWRHR